MTTIQPTLLGVQQEFQTTDDYYTPPWIFENMGIEFDLDVASCPGGVPWIPAKTFYDMSDDGVAQPWSGRVWMNPPYSGPTPFIDRFIDHANGVCLVPFSKSKWCTKLWDSAHGICMLPVSMKFIRNNVKDSISFPTMLAAFTPECVEAISRVGKVR